MRTRPADRAALVQFDTDILRLPSMTHDAGQLDAALAHLAERHPARADLAAGRRHDGTLLYDGLCSVSEDILSAPQQIVPERQQTRKAIVLLTDGVDLHSRLTLGEAIDCLQRADVAVYSILYSGSPADQHNAGWQTLLTLSKVTGGDAFEYDQAIPVTSFYAKIADDLHSQYLLGFTPEAGRRGKYHTLEVKCLRPRLTTEARAGYYDPKPVLPMPAGLPMPGPPPALAEAASSPAPPQAAQNPEERTPPATQQTPAAPAAGPMQPPAAASYDYWPNPVSHTNSDPWLREHHAQIALLKPRVLVIVADNHASIPAVQAFVKQAVAAAAEGSHYHGYSDPQAKPQLQYQIVSIADLRDQVPTPWPRIWPVHLDAQGKPAFDYNGLFSPEMAHALGFRDPADSEKFLDLKQLFERGLINEVWMVYPEIDGQPENGIVGIFDTAARVQVYDKQRNPIPHDFDRCAGNGCVPPTMHGQAHVTMRFAELNITLGVGCFTHAAGHGFDTGLWRAIPEFDGASARFFNPQAEGAGPPHGQPLRGLSE